MALPTTVLLAYFEGVLRDSLRLLLERDGDLRVVGCVGDCTEAVRIAAQSAPDVAVLEALVPGMDGFEAARAMKRVAPGVAVLIVAAQGSPETVRQALEAGASGYLLKTAAGEELVRAVRALASGRRYVGAGVAEIGPELIGTSHTEARSLTALTAREREVLRLVAEGMSSADAAKVLGLSTRSVETYRGRVMHKLKLASVAALVKFAIRNGFTTVD